MNEELNRLFNLMNELPRKGKARFPICEELIRVADLEKNLKYSFEGRKEWMRLNTYYGDRIKAILTFPKFIAMADEYLKDPHCDKSHVQYLIVLVLDYMIGIADEYYQIEYEKVGEIRKEYVKRCVEYGYSLRWYHQEMTRSYMRLKDVEGAKKEYKKFESYPRDDLSDCEACEIGFQVEYELFLNNYDRALELAEPIFKGEKKCHNAIPSTCGSLFDYCTNNNMLEKAEEYRQRVYKIIRKEECYLYYMGLHLLYFAITDPKKGINIFTEHLKWALDSSSRQDRYEFYAGAWLLWESVKYKEKINKCKLILPEDTPFYREDGNYLVDDIISYCKEEAVSSAQKFDKRNRNSMMIDEIDKMKRLVFSNLK